MNLETYYLSSVSVAATLFSILLIVWAVVTVWVVVRVSKVLDKVDKLTEATSDMASSVSELVSTTAHHIISIEKAFLTAQGMKHAAYFVANLFHNRKVYKKGANHEPE
ncbi:MAG: hypothetical protein ABIR48_02425 [Gammaproteobacteria bacterium]